MYFAGSFDPAYSVAIHALASQADQAATNKRNLGLLQKHLSHSLGISPDRGLVRYNVVSEECFGWGGSTVVGQIASDQMRARREKPKRSQTSDEGERRGVVRLLSHRLRSDLNKVRFDETVTTPLRPMARVSEEPVSSRSTPVKATEVEAEPYKEPLSRRASFLQGLFGKQSRVELNVDESAQTP
ncbi:hypothetical protein N3K66_008130 [Trichothecium roseum]|uniref:Uncharacterized protein n=1 Tax=Trichothecium roseum TaxID=47278 RepID=A0ACC0USL9_9HYPO|nr:hypothetical protein N3K66_008130 [Trichothecium roseum]